MGPRALILNLEPKGEDAFDGTLLDYTWPFRAAFDARGLAGGRVNDPVSGTELYVRVIGRVDLNDTERRAWFFELITEAVDHTVLQARLAGAVPVGSVLQRFYDEVLALPHVWSRQSSR